jgi:hypothetical protein
VKLGLLCNLLDQLTNKLWIGHSIEVVAFDAVMPLGKENVGAIPILGTLKPAPNTYNQPQEVSRHETRLQRLASKRRNPLLSLAHVAPPHPKKNTCSICLFPGHQRGSCPKINKSKTPPLEMGKGLISHHELSSSLSKVSCYKTMLHSMEDTWEVSISLPSCSMGIVIH